MQPSSRGYRAATIIVIILLIYSLAFAKPSEEEIAQVFEPAEMLFKAMAEKKYPVIWQMMSARSQQKIVDAVYKRVDKKDIKIEKDAIRADFIGGGAVAKAYWDNYLSAFDPDLALNQSRWTIKKLKKDTAEINILYTKSPNPAVLKLYREEDTWKVGLEETFGARSLMPFK